MNKVTILIFALLLTGCTRSTTPAPAAEIAAQFVMPPTKAVTLTATPYPSPTPDLALMATATAASVIISANQAAQSALGLAVAQSEATLAAFPLSATQTQAVVNSLQATINVRETQTAKTQSVYSTSTAYAPTARAIERAEAQAPIWDGIRISMGVICALAFLLVVLYIYCVKSWELSEAKRDREIYRERAEVEAMNSHPSNRDGAMMFERAPDGGYVRKPAITEISEQKIAEYVRVHGWNDDMRNDGGISMSHERLVLYRDYLVKIGVLRQTGNRYDVIKPEYFNNPLPHREQMPDDAESTGSDMLQSVS